MKRFEILQMEQNTIDRFKNEESLNTFPFSVETNVRWKQGDYPTEYDIVIGYNDIPYAVVEIAQPLSKKITFEVAKRRMNIAFKQIKCCYSIITDGIDFYICDSRDKDNYQKNTFLSILSILRENVNILNVENEQVDDEIENILEKHKLGGLLNRIENRNGQYHFRENAEFDFWSSLLEDASKNITKIYRYTTLDKAFYILNNKTYSMNGIIGMNDKSEIDYFDNYCYTSKNKPSYLILNNLYLSSCSLLYDDLTMWRLYGEDAKGVCLTFEYNEKSTQDFLLQCVSYATEDGKNQKLDLIKKLISKQFVLKEIDMWKHFFKAKDYSIEQEVRLLYMDDKSKNKNREWLRTNDTSIINPYIVFDFNSENFPLTITEVTLGPKCPEKETNMEQLKELIKQRKYANQIEIKLSSIKNYR